MIAMMVVMVIVPYLFIGDSDRDFNQQNGLASMPTHQVSTELKESTMFLFLIIVYLTNKTTYLFHFIVFQKYSTTTICNMTILYIQQCYQLGNQNYFTLDSRQMWQ
jgi:hypothetical protein